MSFYRINKSDIDKNYVIKIGESGYGRSYYETNKILLALKFNVNSLGFRYWIYAISQYRKYYFKYDNKIERVYSEVAKFYGTTRNRVERAMRVARTPATEEIQNRFNYYGKITNKSVLELLTHNYRILFDDIEKHIPRID